MLPPVDASRGVVLITGGTGMLGKPVVDGDAPRGIQSPRVVASRAEAIAARSRVSNIFAAISAAESIRNLLKA